jgi:subfamily B ATP-binding cassette protein MsbA
LNPSVLKRLWRQYIAPQARLFFLASFFMLVGSMSTAALPFLLQPVFDHILAKGDINHLVKFCSAVFFAFFFKGLSAYGESVSLTSIGQKLIADVQKRLFSHLMYCDLAFFHQTPTGEMISRMTHDVQILRQTLSHTVLGVGRDTITLIFLVLVMVYRDPFLTFLALIVFPLCVLPVIKLGKRMRRVTLKTQEHIASLVSYLTQIFQSIRVVKTYHQEEREIAHVASFIDKVVDLTKRSNQVKAASHPLMETLAGLAIVSVIAYGGIQVMKFERTTGEFISFIGALLLIYEPIKRLTQLSTNMQEGLAAAQRLFLFIDWPIQIKDGSKEEIDTIEGEIAFDKIKFSYSAQPLFENFSLTIKKGSSVAFVGPSGAGKTTLLNLIPRFYDVDAGRVLIDGIDIKDLPLKNLRDHIALVSQDIALFDGTVSENIAYAKPSASLEEIQNAAKIAAAHNFIQKLPKQYDTSIGENGVLLSGGQRQRIAFARAILKNASILLLDEATSALDNESEKQVQESLTHFMKGRTTIMVAHRLSTIRHVDKIYVLDHGRIIQEGKHEDLISQEGLYKALWLSSTQEGL